MSQTRKYFEVARAIREMIVDERLRSGDRLPPERSLAERLDVTRSLLREAMILLEIEGIVEVRKGAGTFLTDQPHTANLPARGDIGPFELLQARQLLESDIAGLAARMVTKGDITRLRATLEAERAGIEAGRADYDADHQFHRQIAEATQNAVLVDVVDNLWRQREQSPMWARLHDRIFERSYRRNWLSDHSAILAALQAKNPQEARDAMWAHLGAVRETLMELSDVDDPEFDGYLFEPVVISA